MSKVYSIEEEIARKKAEEIKVFLLELDSICDILYNRLEYQGIWDVLDKMEDVRLRYYIELYEYESNKDRKKT